MTLLGNEFCMLAEVRIASSKIGLLKELAQKVFEGYLVGVKVLFSEEFWGLEAFGSPILRCCITI